MLFAFSACHPVLEYAPLSKAEFIKRFLYGLNELDAGTVELCYRSAAGGDYGIARIVYPQKNLNLFINTNGFSSMYGNCDPVSGENIWLEARALPKLDLSKITPPSAMDEFFAYSKTNSYESIELFISKKNDYAYVFVYVK